MEQNTPIENVNPEADKNLEAAKSEIEVILKKYNVVLVPVVIHHGDKTFSRIDITSLQETPQASQA